MSSRALIVALWLFAMVTLSACRTVVLNSPETTDPIDDGYELPGLDVPSYNPDPPDSITQALAPILVNDPALGGSLSVAEVYNVRLFEDGRCIVSQGYRRLQVLHRDIRFRVSQV
jgi:hypothetical protein